MEIETERLILKELIWDDLETIHNLYSLPEVDEYNTLGIPKNIEETRRIVQSMMEAQNVKERKSFSWKIVKKGFTELIGMAGLVLSADRFKMGEISYELFPSHWGYGYAT